jgi:thiaminase/transcriptional activator TenA
MSLSHHLWSANTELSRASLESPFVQGIRNGSLSRDRFAHYVGQDAFYLEAFARAYTVAAAKMPTWEDFQALHTLAGGVFEELRMHQQYAAEWGINLQSVAATPTTRRYTDFLLATAWSSDVGLTMAAMSPCMQLYVYIGQELARTDPPKHAYTHWIQTYSDPALDQLAQQLADLTDRYASDTRQVYDAYRYAMQCEYDFFQSAWESAP